jgi:tRNA pseudouridine38-40 synthase
MNVRLELKFDGTNYHGWQLQPGRPTVQGMLTEAVYEVTGERVTIHGCGRTDSGVHASSYTASFKTDTSVPITRLPYALNANLPDDIRCISAASADDDFSAGRSAKGKTYRYTIDNNEFEDVFLLRFAWHVKYPLDVGAMSRAASYFEGTHDFVGFASSGYSVKTTVRTIHSLSVSTDGNIITIDITGNGFLYNMVRIISGTLVYVGSGRIDEKDIPGIIASRQRAMAGITAPAKGLCLKEVFY